MSRRIATVLAASIAVGLPAVLTGAVISAPTILAECPTYDPVLNEEEWWPEGQVLDTTDGYITCHNGHWDGPNVDSPMPGGGRDLPA
jgi:hypothetical protein